MSGSFYLKCRLVTSSMDITWDLAGNSDSQAPCPSESKPADLFAAVEFMEHCCRSLLPYSGAHSNVIILHEGAGQNHEQLWEVHLLQCLGLLGLPSPIAPLPGPQWSPVAKTKFIKKSSVLFKSETSCSTVTTLKCPCFIYILLFISPKIIKPENSIEYV